MISGFYVVKAVKDFAFTSFVDRLCLELNLRKESPFGGGGIFCWAVYLLESALSFSARDQDFIFLPWVISDLASISLHRRKEYPFLEISIFWAVKLRWSALESLCMKKHLFAWSVFKFVLDSLHMRAVRIYSLFLVSFCLIDCEIRSCCRLPGKR